MKPCILLILFLLIQEHYYWYSWIIKFIVWIIQLVNWKQTILIQKHYYWYSCIIKFIMSIMQLVNWKKTMETDKISNVDEFANRLEWWHTNKTFQCVNCEVNDVLRNSNVRVGIKPGIIVFISPYLPLINLIIGIHTGDCLRFSIWDFDKSEHCKSNEFLWPD